MFSFCHVLKELNFDHNALQQSSLMIVSWPEGEHKATGFGPRLFFIASVHGNGKFCMSIFSSRDMS